MSNGIILTQGRIFKAILWHENGPFYCAVGSGDASFTDPLNPPAENASQTGLLGEQLRRRYTSRKYLTLDVNGVIQFGSRTFTESLVPSTIVLFEWLFDFNEANFTWKEFCFHGGTITFGQFYNGSAPPIASGIAGVTVRFVSSANGEGAGTLSFIAAGTTLKWQAPSSASFGAPVNVGGGGDFQLIDGDNPSATIRVAVAAGSLPGVDTSVNPTLANAGDFAAGGLNSAANPTGQVDSSGYGIFLRNIPDQIKTNAEQRPVRLLIEP